MYPWPVETGGAKYSCATDFASTTPYPIFLEPSPEGSENILTNLVSCPPAPNSTTNISLLSRTGGALATCQTNGLTGTYKLISSLIKHSDPSSKIYGAQLKGISSPNIPVDEERYLSYLDRSAHEARVNYPNLFDISVTPNDSDDVILQKITTFVDNATSNLKPGIDFPVSHPWKKLIKFTDVAPKFSEVLLANQDVRAGLIDALRWKSLDTEAKYARAFDLALSKVNTNAKLIVPDKKDIYEISYMGGTGDARDFAFGFSPEDKTELPDWFQSIQKNQENVSNQNSGNDSDTTSEFSLSNSEIASLL